VVLLICTPLLLRGFHIMVVDKLDSAASYCSPANRWPLFKVCLITYARGKAICSFRELTSHTENYYTH
jgi:hypothetical protein